MNLLLVCDSEFNKIASFNKILLKYHTNVDYYIYTRESQNELLNFIEESNFSNYTAITKEELESKEIEFDLVIYLLSSKETSEVDDIKELLCDVTSEIVIAPKQRRKYTYFKDVKSTPDEDVYKLLGIKTNERKENKTNENFKKWKERIKKKKNRSKSFPNYMTMKKLKHEPLD